MSLEICIFLGFEAGECLWYLDLRVAPAQPEGAKVAAVEDTQGRRFRHDGPLSAQSHHRPSVPVRANHDLCNGHALLIDSSDERWSGLLNVVLFTPTNRRNHQQNEKD